MQDFEGKFTCLELQSPLTSCRQNWLHDMSYTHKRDFHFATSFQSLLPVRQERDRPTEDAQTKTVTTLTALEPGQASISQYTDLTSGTILSYIVGLWIDNIVGLVLSFFKLRNCPHNTPPTTITN